MDVPKDRPTELMGKDRAARCRARRNPKKESAAKGGRWWRPGSSRRRKDGTAGRSGAGMWSAVVVGTHPIEANQEVWLEICVDDVSLGRCRLLARKQRGQQPLARADPAAGRSASGCIIARWRGGPGSETGLQPCQDTIVRPNLPDRTESSEIVGPSPEGLVGNRLMTRRVDGRGSTYDVYFPTVGLHSDVRPAEGDWPQSRSHFRAIIGGLAVGRRLDWFTERLCWEAFQQYQGATNLLTTKLSWRHGPIRVLATDFVAMGDCCRAPAGGTDSPRPVHQAVPHHQRGDRAAARRSSASTSRPRSTAASATPG